MAGQQAEAKCGQQGGPIKYCSSLVSTMTESAPSMPYGVRSVTVLQGWQKKRAGTRRPDRCSEDGLRDFS
jgi:hypothetical protein